MPWSNGLFNIYQKNNSQTNVVVQCATTTNIDLNSAPAIIDNYTLMAGDLILVKDQTEILRGFFRRLFSSTPDSTDNTANGIYVFTSVGAPLTRWEGASEWYQFIGAVYIVEYGNINDGTNWVSSAITGGEINITPLSFVKISGLYTASGGVDLINGNTFTLTATSAPIHQFANGVDTVTREIVYAQPAFNDLSDVLIVSPINEQILIYNSATNKWNNQSASYITLASTLAGLSITGGAITSGSTVLEAFGALQNQINTISGGYVTSITGTANQVIASASTGAITLSLPQSIASSSSPTFTALTLSANTNQLTLGAGNTTTITMAALTGNRTFTLPDANSNSVQPLGSATANNWVQFIDANGVQNLARPNTRNLSDIGNSIPSNNQVLIYSGLSQQYFPQTISGAITITNLGVTTLANMANNTIKGNVSGSTATPTDLTVTQVLGMLGVTPSNGQVIYSTASALAVTSGTLTTNKPLVATAGGAPTWSNITLPLSVTVNSLVYASTANNLTQLETIADAVLVTSAGKVPSFSQTLPIDVQDNITNLGNIEYAIYVNDLGGTLYGSTLSLMNSNGDVPMQNNKAIGSIIMSGSADTFGSIDQAAIIEAVTTQAWNTSNHGTILNFKICPTNSTTLATPVSITSNRLSTTNADINVLTSANSTFGSVIALQNNQGVAQPVASTLGSVIFTGSHNGTTLTNSAYIKGVARELWSGSARGTSLECAITINGTTSTYEMFSITADKFVATNSDGVSAGSLHYALRTTSKGLRWAIGLDNAEATGNVGNDFALWSYSNTGAFVLQTLTVGRADGKFTYGGTSLSSQTARQEVLCASAYNGTVYIPISNISYTPITFRSNSNGFIGSITCTTTNTAFNTSSDYRLKDNVVDYVNGLDTLDKLRPVKYTWKTDNSTGEGFLAHELQEVLPHAVTGEKDAKKLITKAVHRTEYYDFETNEFVKSSEAEYTGTKIKEELSQETTDIVDGITYKLKIYTITYTEDESKFEEIYQQVDYSKVVPLLTAALKELHEQVKQLKEQIMELQNV